MVERVALLVELFEDDVADLFLDLLARHFVERGQIDEAQQPLVKLDLQVGVQVIGGERAGIADGHQPPFLFGPFGDFFGRCFVLGLANLPHDQCSSPSAAATPLSIASMSFASGHLRRTSPIGTPRSIAWFIVS